MLESMTTTTTTTTPKQLKRRKPTTTTASRNISSSSSSSSTSSSDRVNKDINAKGLKNNNDNDKSSSQQQQRRKKQPTRASKKQQQQAKRGNRTKQTTTSAAATAATAELSPEEQEQYVAIDCEMVGVGLYGCRSALARVTLLDWNGQVVLDTLVRPQEEVTDYRTFVSGISAEDFLEHVDDGDDMDSDGSSHHSKKSSVMDFDTCRQLVLSLIENKVIIGHGLKNDLHALHIYNHPWHLQRDTTKYEPFQRDESHEDNNHHNSDGSSSSNYYYDVAAQQRRPAKARKLKDLVYEKLHRTIQPMGSVHDPIEDALGALDLYKLVRSKWEKCMAYKIAKTNQIIAQSQQQQQQMPEEEPQEGSVSDDCSTSSSSSSGCDTSSQTDSEEEDVAVVSE